MLLEQFKNKEKEKEIIRQWQTFRFKNGHKEINVANFLKLNYCYCHYKIEKRYYEGYFESKEIDFIFAVLDYHKGKIIALMG